MAEIKQLPSTVAADPRLKMVRTVSKLMDEQFHIGGFKFGIDPLLNLIPVAGDLGSYLVSVSLIITMVRFGASGKLAMKMIGNATIDALVGAIPVLGWIFDFAYKANTRNVKLLTEHYGEGRHTGSAKPIIITILVIVVIVLLLLAFISYELIAWFFNYFRALEAQPASF